MTKELTEFFKKLEKENKYDYFLLRKLYINPESVFNDKDEDIDKENYYDKNTVYSYMFNNNFLTFLDLAYDDEEFLNKLNYNMLKSIYEFLNEVDRIVLINTDNTFTHTEIFEFIKSRIVDKKLYKMDNVREKMKKYNLDVSYNLLITTEQYMDFYSDQINRR